MYTEVMVILAFILILAVTAGFYTCLKITSGESLIYATLTLIVVMYIGGSLRAFRWAVAFYGVLALAGALLYIIKSRDREFFSPSLAAVTLMYLGATVLFHRDFIQKIDDYHQWAAAVKYMLEKGHFPLREDFIGDPGMPLTTGLYHLYFQILGGYQEGNMYASAFLFTATALMLPMCYKKYRQRKVMVFYIAVTYLGLFSLFDHPYKSLYVDLPVAAWGGALCVWWTVRLQNKDSSETKTQRNSRIVLAVMMLVTIVKIKLGIGLIMAGFSAVYILCADGIYAGKDRVKAFIKKYRTVLIIALIAVVAAALAAFFAGSGMIPVSTAGLKEALGLHTARARLTFKKLFTDTIFNKTIAPASRYRLTAVPVITGLLVMMIITAVFRKGRDRSLMVMETIFSFCAFVLYLGALYVTYVSTYSYTESVTNAAAHRYLALILMYIFFIYTGNVFLVMTGEGPDSNRRVLYAMRIIMLVFFLVGLNAHFIPAASSADTKIIYGYRQITRARTRTARVNRILDRDDRVYLLVQGMNEKHINEFSMCVPLYYREDKISNYLTTPWKFNESGSRQLFTETPVMIDSLPEILKDGDYSYIWLYSTDDYIKKELPRVFDYTGEVQKGLYKVSWKGDTQELSFYSGV